MKRKLEHSFVEEIPETISDGVLFVSIPYRVAIHLCCCGCGSEVVTPVSPTDWKIVFDGESVSLHPSIGNWEFECRSHYWIRNSQVVWAEAWSDEMVQAGRRRDRKLKRAYSDPGESLEEDREAEVDVVKPSGKERRGIWRFFLFWKKGR